MNDQYKVLCLVSHGEKLEWGKQVFADRDIATLISDSNKNAELYMKQKDKDILEGIIKEEEMNCDVIFTTKFLDVGININAHQSFLVGYYSNEMMNTIEQFRSRIRYSQESPFHLDMIFKVMTKQSSLSKINKIKYYLQRYDEVYKAYGTFESILVNNPKQKFKTKFGNKEEEDYEQYNDITRQLKLEQLAFYEELYYSKDLVQIYKKKLQSMYPYAQVTTLQELNLEAFLNNLLEGEKEIVLMNEEKEMFREKMRNFDVATTHKSTLSSVNTINKVINTLGYKVTNDERVYLVEDKKHIRVWKLIRTANAVFFSLK